MPPTVTVNNVTANSQIISLNLGEPFLPQISVYDPDVALGNMLLTVSFTPNDGSVLSFIDRSTGQKLQNSDLQETDTTSGTQITGKMISINSILSGFEFVSSRTVPTDYTFTITISDLGNTGQCPFDANGNPIPYNALTLDLSSSCALTNSTTLTVNYVNPDTIRDYAIAGSSAAFFAIGILAAALAVRAANGRAESASYKPWDVFHESDAVLSNPLYEEGTIGGASGIYEGKTKGPLDGSSSESPQYVGLDNGQPLV